MTTMELGINTIGRLSTGSKKKYDDGLNIEEKQRIVLVSPFASFNFLAEHIIQDLSRDRKVELDIVNVAMLPKEPYIDVNGRERVKESLPSCVLDFHRIGVKEGEQTRMERFSNYGMWITDTIKTMKDLKTRYLVPSADSELMHRLACYEPGKCFDPYSFRVSDLADMLRTDLASVLCKANDGFYLFSEVVAKN